jgi:hypothetical protein
MRDTAGTEERAGARMRAVDELIDQHKGARGQLRLERAAGRKRNHMVTPRA